MSIELHQIDLDNTDYVGKTALDFLNSREELSAFYPYLKDSDHALRALARQKQSFAHRTLLTESIIQQYASSGIDLDHPENIQVKKNIDLLLHEDTCTATTGQQIHIFLGPVFVWYKILSVIDDARRASEMTGHPVIPVFWMASEDHDLEEVNHIRLYGQKYTWETNQTGPVGRMRCTLLPELADQLIERTLNDPEQQQFLRLCREHYDRGLTFSEATRNIVHSLFRSHGLVILDADRPELKALFIPVFKEELTHQITHLKVLSQNQKLSEAGYPVQVNPREINLFYFRDNHRIRIQKDPSQNNSLFLQDQPAESINSWINLLEKNPENFSPNALLRPAYQETILPNIIYVCGGSELSYWMQLSELFTHLNVSFPVLCIRAHGLILKKKIFQKLTAILPVEAFFMAENEFKSLLMEEKQAEILGIEQHLENLDSQLTQLKSHIETSFLSRSISWKEFSEHGKHIDQLKKVVKTGVDHYFSQNEFMESALRLKSKIFTGPKQERSSALIEFLSTLNQLNISNEISIFMKRSKFNLLLTD